MGAWTRPEAEALIFDRRRRRCCRWRPRRSAARWRGWMRPRPSATRRGAVSAEALTLRYPYEVPPGVGRLGVAGEATQPIVEDHAPAAERLPLVFVCEMLGGVSVQARFKERGYLASARSSPGTSLRWPPKCYPRCDWGRPPMPTSASILGRVVDLRRRKGGLLSRFLPRRGGSEGDLGAPQPPPPESQPDPASRWLPDGLPMSFA